MKYRGEIGKVRLALEIHGATTGYRIFNDNRDGGTTCTASTNYAQPGKGVARRIKIWHAGALMQTDLVAFDDLIKLAFFGRLIKTKVDRKSNSFLIYLKD